MAISLTLSGPLPALERTERNDERYRRHGKEKDHVPRVDEPAPEAAQAGLEAHVAERVREPACTHRLGDVVEPPEGAEHEEGDEEAHGLALDEGAHEEPDGR